MPQGINTSFGLARESTYGTPVAPTVYIPITKESMAAPREMVQLWHLQNNRTLETAQPGIIQARGGFDTLADGLSESLPLKLWNGTNGHTAAALTTLNTVITVAPSAVVSGAGTIPAGTYRYSVALLIRRALDGLVVIMAVSGLSAPVAVTGTDAVALTYTAPSTHTPPLGFVPHGVAIYRTDSTGLAGTERFLKSVVSVVGSASDTGTNPFASPSVVPPTAAFYRHRMIQVPGLNVEPLDSFTVTTSKDNDQSERYAGCRMSEFGLSAGSGNSPIELAFSLLSTRVSLTPNVPASFTALDPILGWKAAAFVNGGPSCQRLESFDIRGTNSCKEVRGTRTDYQNLGVASGTRRVSLSFRRSFVDHTFFNYVIAGNEFSFKLNAYGQPASSQNSQLFEATHGIDAIPFPHFFEVELFRCRGGRAGGNVVGLQRIPETIEAVAFRSPAVGTEMRITLYNTLSTF